MDEWEKHHPWCNYFSRPREGCKMCDRLFEGYPLKEGMTIEDLLAKHFPDVKRVR